jgi:hypothetical protein
VIDNINPSLTVGTEELNNQRAATTMHKKVNNISVRIHLHASETAGFIIDDSYCRIDTTCCLYNKPIEWIRHSHSRRRPETTARKKRLLKIVQHFPVTPYGGIFK